MNCFHPSLTKICAAPYSLILSLIRLLAPIPSTSPVQMYTAVAKPVLSVGRMPGMQLRATTEPEQVACGCVHVHLRTSQIERGVLLSR